MMSPKWKQFKRGFLKVLQEDSVFKDVETALLFGAE